MDDTIGKKIRYLRRKSNITLDQFALTIGFSKGYLSKIERGLQIPPIATLSRIAHALNIEVADFFETRRRKVRCSIVPKNQRRLVIRNDSGFGYHYEAIAYKKHDKVINPFIITLTPHANDQTIFSHEGQEMMLVLEGTMEFWFGDEKHIIEAGDCVYFDSEVFHRGQCVGDNEAKVLVVIYSPQKHPVQADLDKL